MSLSPLVSFKSRFVTYILNFPRIFNFRVHFAGAESEDFYVSRKSSVFGMHFLYPWITKLSNHHV